MKNKKTPGQIVVILTLVLAILILLTIVIINIGKITDIKTATSQIADRGALGLGSQLAAYIDVLKQTLVHKSQATTPLGTGFGCVCDELSCTCLNWGLIIPLIGMLFAIVLMVLPVTLPIGILLSFVAINPLLNEVNEIMRSGFNNAAAELTQYSGMRESSIASMLDLAQADAEVADRIPGTDRFKYVYDHRWDPVQKKYVEVYYEYNIADSPIAAKYRNHATLPRYVAWYWSKRFMNNAYPVSERALTPFINDFVDALVAITEFNTWDQQRWNYTEVSLKVQDQRITCGSGENTCPEWAVKDKEITRIISHVSAREPNLLDWLATLLGLGGPQGFLPVKFTELTKRLLDNPTYGGYITWDVREVKTVSEILRGLMLRDMELLNLPISARIPTIDNWLPVWYNTQDHSQDLYTRIGEILNGNGTIRGINEWWNVLRSIEPEIRTQIEAPWGNNHYGRGDWAKWCHPGCIECCHDCPCRCCGSGWAECTWYGEYCTACGGPNPPACIRHDLYHTKPSWCPLVEKADPCYVACGRCADSPFCHDACQFQGLLGWNATGFSTEIAQAILILGRLRAELTQLRTEILTLATNAQPILNPSAAVQAVQKHAIYGWVDKNDNLNICRVRLDNYPARNRLPYIKESFIWGGIFKRWEIVNPVSGNFDVTVSRYTSDIPAGWWNLRYRKNPGGAEWNRGTLDGIIRTIQQTGVCNIPESDWDTYAITSATRGYFGMRKEDIRIERLK